ncbi:MAG: hypothetical protein IJ371_05830 [Clostridia bacterium]|nr:hypothetical protein [Clostridia bacterium]
MVATIICVVIAVFAIVILYLTRSNIIDLLDRDMIMYDKNYALKKESLEEAFNCLDLVAQNGVEIKSNPQFIARAKEAYNDLLCTLYSAKLYQQFYAMAIDVNVSNYSVEDIEKFKIACRAELVSKRKTKGEGFKGTANGVLNGGNMQNQITSILQQPQSAPMPQPRPQQPAQPRPQPRPQQPLQRPQGQPQPRPQTPVSAPIDDENDVI